MKIILAKYSGFCSGVERSAKLAIKNRFKKPIYTWGPLIHNLQFVEYLNQKNIRQTQDFNLINERTTIIIRSHGITKQILDKLKKTRATIINGTCPNVTKVQKLAEIQENKGFQIIIFGDPEHPEVKGIKSYVLDLIVINSISNAKKINKFNKICFISQTTQSLENFQKIIPIIKDKAKIFKVFNTICNATKLRQDNAKKLAKIVDIMIIIGGKHSSNTKKLFQICSKIVKSYHIETRNELKNEWFKNKNTAGVTAGASTPNWIINNVVNKIKTL